MSCRFGARGAAAGPGRRRQRGQATVELALLLPVIVIIGLAAAQVGLVVHARVMVTHAAREGARVAAVGGSDSAVVEAAGAAGGLDPSRLDVSVDRSAGRAIVRVDYDAPTSVPLVGALIDAVPLTATATMRLE